MQLNVVSHCHGAIVLHNLDDQECVITVNSSIAKRVSQTIFLGIVLDDKLTWKNHINHIYTRKCPN